MDHIKGKGCIVLALSEADGSTTVHQFCPSSLGQKDRQAHTIHF